MTKSYFLTFEGGEGAGKTTLLEAVFQKLTASGLSVIKTREPGGTALGEKIRSLLLQEKDPISPWAELSLFLASRAQHIGEIIAPALQKGQIVLCDRFNDSTIAYQGVARSLGMEKVETMCQLISSHVQPDLTLYLDIDPLIGLQRVKTTRHTDRIEQETLAFHQKIRDGYLQIHKKHPKRFHLLDATLPPDTLLQQALCLIPLSATVS